MAIALVSSILFNIVIPIFCLLTLRMKRDVVLWDLTSGTLLVSPIVDPSDSKDILDTSSTMVARAIVNRSPAGFDDDKLIPILFDTDTARKVRGEMEAEDPKTHETVGKQYRDKNLRSRLEIENISGQSISNSIHGPYIKVRVTGQCIITGVVNGSVTYDVQSVTLDLSLVHNPYLGINKRYPLMCFEYSYGGQNVSKK